MIEVFGPTARVLTLALAQSVAEPAHPHESRQWSNAAQPLAVHTRNATRLAAVPRDGAPESAQSNSRARNLLLAVAAIAALLAAKKVADVAPPVRVRDIKPGNSVLAQVAAVSAITAAATGLMLMFPFVLTGPAGQSIAEILNPIAIALAVTIWASRLASQIVKRRPIAVPATTSMRLSQRHPSG